MKDQTTEPREMAGKSSPISLTAGLLLFVLALGYYLWAVSVGWHHTIDDHYGWRQSQTAITASYMVGKPFKLAYETPIYGPPWSTPLEFPLYQWIVARMSALSGYGLEPTGRAVGVLFHLLTLLPASLILSAFGIVRGSRLLLLSLWLVCPFYIFWSRTFMIESTSMFFSMAFLAGIVRSRSRRAVLWLGMAAVCGSLAAVVKITTFLTFGLIGGGLIAFHTWQSRRTPRVWMRSVIALMAVGGLPFASLIAWTKFADDIKSAHPLGRGLMSTALKAWNFGTMQQKLSPATWKLIMGRVGQLFVETSPWLLWPCILVMIGLGCIVVGRRRLIVGCLLLFFVPSAVFTNLHYVHDYYLYASGVFVVFAVGICALHLMEQRRFQWIGIAYYALLACVSVAGFFRKYHPIQATDHLASWNAARSVRDNSEPNAVNIFLGASGDPTVAYFSGRRAVLIINGCGEDAIREEILNLRGCQIGGIFVEEGNRYPVDWFASLLRENGFGKTPVHELRVTQRQ